MEVSYDPYLECKLPDDLDCHVWHYMDLFKFEDIAKSARLYLCRTDRLQEYQDLFEGTYSQQQIQERDDWLQNKLPASAIENLHVEANRRLKTTYISCWCLGDADLHHMWKSYTQASEGVAVRTTVKRLLALCKKAITLWPLDLSQVTYFDHAGGKTIPDNMLSPFLHKDLHFALDNEVRIIKWSNSHPPAPDHIDVAFSASELIEEVVLHPGATSEFRKKVTDIMSANAMASIPLNWSRFDRRPVVY
jgi:hypothetical protein